jgi:uncharacterized protein (TIGR02217 family)
MGLSSLDELHEVIAFFEARRGQLHAFRWKDWLDWKSCAPSAEPTAADQEIGIGDGQTVVFQLSKLYEAAVNPWRRDITKPVAGSVRVAVGGLEKAEGADWSVDAATGLVTFEVAPEAGRLVTAGFEFDVPVRFDADRIVASLSALDAGDIPSIPVVEVRV